MSARPQVYPLAEDVFFTYQGEGHLSGLPMVFIRLAGCSVGCALCDTDYKSRHVVDQFWLAEMVDKAIAKLCHTRATKITDRWVWITGGEPADHNLAPLIDELHAHNFSVAVATSGNHKILPPVEWLSVSPHSNTLQQRFGNEIKLVPGLNGLDPYEWIHENPDHTTEFWFRFVQPLWGDEKSKKKCLEFVNSYPNWGLTIQSHKFWGLP